MTRGVRGVLIVSLVSILALLGLSPGQASEQAFATKQKIAFTSTRDTPSATTVEQLFAAMEIYLMNPDGTDPRRLTNNTDADLFPALSPDGKKLVVDSNRLRGTGPLNTSDLFLIDLGDYDGLHPIPDNKQVHLTRGGSPTWSADGRRIAFHASGSGTGLPIKDDPSAATSDSDIFVMNVDDCLKLFTLTNKNPNTSDCRTITAAECNMVPDLTKRAECNKIVPELSKNITKQFDTDSVRWIDDDANWGPSNRIVFTRHPTTDNVDNSIHADMYVINADGTGLTRLTVSYPEGSYYQPGIPMTDIEERAPAWSADGMRIAFMGRIGLPQNPTRNPTPTFEICVINVNGTGQALRLTTNNLPDASPSWSPESGSTQIVFAHGPTRTTELWRIDAAAPVLPNDGSATILASTASPMSPGIDFTPGWGVVRVRVQ